MANLWVQIVGYIPVEATTFAQIYGASILIKHPCIINVDCYPSPQIKSSSSDPWRDVLKPCRLLITTINTKRWHTGSCWDWSQASSTGWVPKFQWFPTQIKHLCRFFFFWGGSGIFEPQNTEILHYFLVLSPGFVGWIHSRCLQV